ncbi:MAG: hypothetical protein M5R41_06710 [Bacteroidia bacterium]|nr:hypothetical protein [Bacteroidia bacterium]
MKRILLATLAGGVIIFVWGAVSHMLLGAGMLGVSVMSNEDPVLEALSTNLPEAGLYMFPGWDLEASAFDEPDEAWMNKYRDGPAGMLIYRPKGGEVMPPSTMVSEFVSNLLAALLFTLLASALAGSYGKRVALLSLLGLFSWLSISVSYWIWYHFPLAYIAGEGIDVVFACVLAAIAIAKIVPAPAAKN